MMKSRLIFFLLFVFSFKVFGADSEFMKYLSQQMDEFKQFKEERDKEFTEFLKKQWKDYEMFKGLEPDTVPKPADIPVVKEEKPLIVKQVVPDKVIIKTVEPPVVVEKPVKIIPLQNLVREKDKTLFFNFFNVNVELVFDEKTPMWQLKGLSNEDIALFWENAAKSNFDKLVNSVKDAVKKLSLGDWGTVIFTKKATTQIYNGDSNRGNLLAWFVLSKLGFDARVGVEEGMVYLLLPSDKKIYGVTYFVLDGKNYYAIDTFETRKYIKSIRTYDGKYPGSSELIKINAERPLLPDSYHEKTVSFRYNGHEYRLNLSYDASLVEFYRLFPQTELYVFTNPTISDEALYKMKTQLAKIIEGKSEIEAANILLRFVQTAFKYKTDIDQFGYEKYFIPEETIYYPYSDCEDRAILYSYLVKNMLNLDTVLLDYPGHVATAINLKGSVGGDFVDFEGKRYYVADPTYINANIGMTMPNVAKYKPKVIK